MVGLTNLQLEAPFQRREAEKEAEDLLLEDFIQELSEVVGKDRAYEIVDEQKDFVSELMYEIIKSLRNGERLDLTAEVSVLIHHTHEKYITQMEVE